MLGYKNRSFEYASLINSGLLVFFRLNFDQEVYFRVRKFYGLVFFRVVFLDFRWSSLSYLPRVVPPGFLGCFIFGLVGGREERGGSYFWLVSKSYLLKMKVICNVFQLTGLHINHNTGVICSKIKSGGLKSDCDKGEGGGAVGTAESFST